MLVAGAAAYASQPTLGKIAYDHGADTVGLLTVRFGAAALLLLAALAPSLLRRERLLPRGGAGLVALATVVYVGQSYTFFESLARMDAAPTILVLYLYPLFVAAGSALVLRRPLTRRQALLLPVTLLGVALSVGVTGRVTADGVAFGLASALFYAVFFLLSKAVLDRGGEPLRMTTAVYAGTAVAYLAMALGGGAAIPHGAAGWSAVGVTVVVGTIASAVLVLLGLRRLPAPTASMLMLTEPVAAIALAAVALGEPIGALQALGAAIVVGSLLLLTRSGPARPPA
nr:DMT family transporter [Conexibacter arvalis]